MRGSGWLLPIIAVVAWLATVTYPFVASLITLSNSPRTEVEIRSALALLATSVLWAGAVAIGSVICGWAPGRWLGKSLAAGGNLRFVLLATLTLAPIALPSYVLFYAWWQSWPADGAIHLWVVKHGLMTYARQATLFIGLVCWSWPLVSWCVAGTAANKPAQREELLLLDGVGTCRRCLDRLRCDARGLAVGALLVFLATLANTTCFDLAEVFTFANELRAIQALNATVADVMMAAVPGVAISVFGSLLVWRALAPSIRRRQSTAAIRIRKIGWFSICIACAVWLASVAAPIGLFMHNLFVRHDAQAAFIEFFKLYLGGAINTLLFAAISGVIGALIAIGLTIAWIADRRWVRRAANVIGISWLLVAMCPATIIGAALQHSYNRAMFESQIAMTPAMLILGHLACFGFVAALLARWAAHAEPKPLSDLRRMDGVRTLFGMMEAIRPRLLAAAAATFAVIFVLSIGEIPVTALIHPPYRPGYGPLALTLLNDMHYQRPQTVMVGSLGMMMLAFGAALFVAMVWRMNMRRAV